MSKRQVKQRTAEERAQPLAIHAVLDVAGVAKDTAETIAALGRREISPGQSYRFRLIKPRGGRSLCVPAQVETGTKG